MTQSQASVSAGREPPAVSVQIVSRASGASPAVAPASATATQTSVTLAPASAQSAGTTLQDTSVNAVWMASLETQCLVQGSTVDPAPALVTPAQVTLMDSPATQTTAVTRSSVVADKATLGPVVINVPLVTMATQSNPVVCAVHAIAMATLTPRILDHVTPGLASA